MENLFLEKISDLLTAFEDEALDNSLAVQTVILRLQTAFFRPCLYLVLQHSLMSSEIIQQRKLKYEAFQLQEKEGKSLLTGTVKSAQKGWQQLKRDQQPNIYISQTVLNLPPLFSPGEPDPT